MRKDRILIIGAFGQLGTELTQVLGQHHGAENVVLADIRKPALSNGLASLHPFEPLNVMESKQLGQVIEKYQITQIYHLAAVLSASGEQDPFFAWQLNMDGTLNVLAAALEKGVRKVFFPSSIAVFGPTTPRQHTPQFTIMEPTTVYGISKQAGERWAEYYFRRYGLDVRGLRYPGLISYKTPPGGGTTDYAVAIFHQALAGKPFRCFLGPETYLPMMYMPDAVRATCELMEAEASKIKVRSAYNLGALSFSPREISLALQNHFPDFEVMYEPDFRQAIADSWPESIDDSAARQDWGWQPAYDLAALVSDMLHHLRPASQSAGVL